MTIYHITYAFQPHVQGKNISTEFAFYADELEEEIQEIYPDAEVNLCTKDGVIPCFEVLDDKNDAYEKYQCKKYVLALVDDFIESYDIRDINAQ